MLKLRTPAGYDDYHLTGRRRRCRRSRVKNRDDVLCLDVSRSMYEYDVEIIKTYRTLARKFDGERLGLVLFDRSPAVVFQRQTTPKPTSIVN